MSLTVGHRHDEQRRWLWIKGLQERARREKRSSGAVLSDLVRQALIGASVEVRTPASSRRGFEPLPHRGRAVSNDLIDQLREDE